MVTRVVSVEMAPRCTNTAFFADILGTVSCISKLILVVELTTIWHKEFCFLQLMVKLQH
jgi:hypothetical protein